MTAVCVFRGLQTVLPFLSALEQIADAQIKLRRIVDIIRAELVRLENRDELRVAEQHGIGTQVRRNFLGLALLDRCARGQQIMVVPQRHLDRVVERDFHRTLNVYGGLRAGRNREGGRA